MKNCLTNTVLLISLLLLFSGCASVRTAGGSSDRNREEYANHRQVDSVTVYVRDSIVLRIAGDTVFHDRWHTLCRDRWRDRSDTLVVRDSLWREVSVMVEKPLNGWQNFQLWAGRIALILLIGGVLFFVVKRF